MVLSVCGMVALIFLFREDKKHGSRLQKVFVKYEASEEEKLRELHEPYKPIRKESVDEELLGGSSGEEQMKEMGESERSEHVRRESVEEENELLSIDERSVERGD